MKTIINNEKTKNKDLIVYKNFWTGQVKLNYNGQDLIKVYRKVYEYQYENKTTEKFTISGNNYAGLYIHLFGNTIQIERKLTWYELVLALSMFVATMIFATLFATTAKCGVWISAIVGGLCGGIGGLLEYLSMYLFRKFDKLYLKIIFALELLAVAIFSSYVITYVIF